MYSWRAKIGLISHVGENMEHAFHLYAPEGVSFSSTKIPTYTDTMGDGAQMLEEIGRAATLFRGYDADAAAVGCEFAAAALFPGFEEECRRLTEERSGLPAVTGASAAIEAIRLLGCKKIAVLSPYDESTQQATAGFLESHGIRVAALCRMDMTQFEREHLPYETADRDFLYKYARSMPAGDAEALFICGESLGTMEIISCLERDLGIPVITSQQALFRSALRISGVRAGIPALGKLMTL